MGRGRHLITKQSPLRRGKVTFYEGDQDANTFRAIIGPAIYDRVMQWNDTGAAKALRVAEQRENAREIKQPCWVPKLNDDLYIGTVDWNSSDMGEVCNLPKSAVAFADESCGNFRSTPMLSLPRHSEQRQQSLPASDLHERSNNNFEQAVMDASFYYPLMVDAVLEHCADGLRLLVGGWPVEPSGWDDENSESADGPWIVEAVLEDFGDGQRLLVGGCPVEPSWDELDTNWSQLGWQGPTPKCRYWDYTQAQSPWNGHDNVCFSQQQAGW